MIPAADYAAFAANSERELDQLQRLAEQLGGFDARIDVEWLDGAMTALAAGPRQVPPAQWCERLLGDAWSRTFADPHAQREALGILQARWNVLVRQLDPQALQDDPGQQRLDPVLLAWDDEPAGSDAQTPAAPPPSSEAEPPVPRKGELWAQGFFTVVQGWTDDWPPELLDEDTPLGPQFEEALARVGLLALIDADALAEARGELDVEGMDRDALIGLAIEAVQTLRLLFVERSPRPQTRRVGEQPGRNDACPCGSGRKFKRCHGA